MVKNLLNNVRFTSFFFFCPEIFKNKNENSLGFCSGNFENIFLNHPKFLVRTTLFFYKTQTQERRTGPTYSIFKTLNLNLIKKICFHIPHGYSVSRSYMKFEIFIVCGLGTRRSKSMY